MRDEDGVVAKFGIRPQSIPDFLAVVGDTADGFPGLPGWGVKAAALTLSQYPHLEGIPKDWREWHPSIRRARLLSESLNNSRSEALLFRTLATLRLDVPVFENVEDLRWKGPRSASPARHRPTCLTIAGDHTASQRTVHSWPSNGSIRKAIEGRRSTNSNVTNVFLPATKFG